MTRQKVIKNELLRKTESRRILRQSLVFREFQKEKNEINKLKWIESEKSGKDIGFEKALFIWARAHRRSWRAEMMKKRRSGPMLNPFLPRK